MFPYLLGVYLGLKSIKNDEEVDLSKIDIVQLEAVLGEAKRIQYPDKYVFTEEHAARLASPKGFGRSGEAVRVIDNAVDNARLSNEEIDILMRELKVYRD